jgi:SPP1 family predicted phage head-tail adaptor
MGLNINAGALRHVIEWYEQPDDTDDKGQAVALVKVYETCMANVRVSSGSQNVAIGAEATDEIITVLAWYDPRVNNSNFILWNSLYYEITHIKPDEILKSMLITAEVQRNG